MIVSQMKQRVANLKSDNIGIVALSSPFWKSVALRKNAYRRALFFSMFTWCCGVLWQNAREIFLKIFRDIPERFLLGSFA